MDTTIFVDLKITSRSKYSFCRDVAPKMRLTESRITVSYRDLPLQVAECQSYSKNTLPAFR